MGYGRYFEELEVGAVYRHWPGRIVSDYDNTLFALVAIDQNPLFLDEEYASTQPFGRRPLIDTLVFSLSVGMSVADTAKPSPTSDTPALFSSVHSLPAIPCMPNPEFSRSANRPVGRTAGSSLWNLEATTRNRKEFWFCAGSTWRPNEAHHESNCSQSY
jgi:hypothetical protein